MDPQNNQVPEEAPQTQPETPQQPYSPQPLPPTAPISSTPYDFGATQPLVKPSHKKRNIIIGVVILLLILVGIGLWFAFGKKDSQPKQNAQTATQASEQQKAEETISPELAKFIKPNTGETWLAQPKEIAKQGYLQYEDDVTYYEVGKRGDNTIIMSAVFQLGDQIDLYEKAPDGTVSLISRYDNQADYSQQTQTASDYSQTFKSNIKIDTSISYDSLSIPKEIPIENGYKLQRDTTPYLGDRLSTLTQQTDDQKQKPQTVKELGGSKITKSEYPYTDTKLTSIGYNVVLPIQTSVTVHYSPIKTDDTTYTWTTGDPTSNAKYHPITRGCGGARVSVTRGDTIKDSDVTTTGKTKEGDTIGEFKDANYFTLNKAYEEFKEYASGEYSDPALLANSKITKADFIKKHVVILHKDKFNQWLIYVADDFAPIAGCAKPVVYLYPTQATSVNVKVGANVKISDPLYNPTAGWTALAQPNGQLTVNGQRYDSLFWEGPGYGEYPSITSGTVVPHAQAAATIRTQLAAQGLNAKESEDFMEYWQNKIPNKPYVRLTWFNTAQLNQLAPLVIKPKPQTTIRVFLDMSGFDQPLSLPAQTFTAPKRNGFTVVEWGGLASTKLY